jgi:FKBP-type peptidyl-prolyl cis-trans isomerase FklB
MVLLTAQCAQEPAELRTEKDKMNYGIGVTIGKDFKMRRMEVDIDVVVKGLKDELTGRKLLLSDDEVDKTMTAYRHALRQKKMPNGKMAAMDNKKEGEDFLAENKKQEPAELKTEKDKVSYSLGVTIGKSFKMRGMEVDVDEVVKGLKDELTGRKLLLNDDELRKAKTTSQHELRPKQMPTSKKAAMENKKEGEDFLAENKKKKGVVTLPSGLQYQILKAGKGRKPVTADTVEVSYRGTFVNGEEIDSSGSETLTFKLDEVIPGWQEALQLMPVGSKWRIVLPSDLAYGERDLGPSMKPNSTLIFEVELVAIKPAKDKGPETENLPDTKTPKNK